jgi:hypothetical protein
MIFTNFTDRLSNGSSVNINDRMVE